MLSDKRVLHILNTALVVLLCVGLFLPGAGGRIFAAVLLPLAAVGYHFLVKKRFPPSIYYRQVTALVAVMGVLYVSLQFVSGLYFGLGRTALSFGIDWALDIVSIVLAVFGIEYIRYIIAPRRDFIPSAAVYLASVAVEMLLFAKIDAIASFGDFMQAFGMTLVPAIVSNLVFQYISAGYTWRPVVAYRLITLLYPFFIPRIPLMSDSLQATVRLLFPLLLFAFIESLYGRKRKYAVKRNKVFEK